MWQTNRFRNCHSIDCVSKASWNLATSSQSPLHFSYILRCPFSLEILSIYDVFFFSYLSSRKPPFWVENFSNNKKKKKRKKSIEISFLLSAVWIYRFNLHKCHDYILHLPLYVKRLLCTTKVFQSVWTESSVLYRVGVQSKRPESVSEHTVR